jgi:multiple sugar transport system permease protein
MDRRVVRGWRVLSGLPGQLDDFFQRRGRGGEALLAFLLLAPGFAILFLFALWPLAASGYMSLFDYRATGTPWVGSGNYTRLAADPAFWNALRVTLWYTVLVVPATLVLSFFCALGLHRVVRGRGLLRTAYFLPYVTSTVAAAMVWRGLFRHPNGAANSLLESLGLPAQQWLIERDGLLHILSGGWLPPELGPSLALCCVILFDVWHGMGFMIVVFIAGLSLVPRELEDAARIDGAGAWQVTWRITAPLLSPTIFFLTIVGTVRAFQAFNSFYALTQDPQRAPFPATQNLVLFLYEQLYRQGDPGYGAAVAVLFAGAIMALAVAQWRLLGRKVHYS